MLILNYSSIIVLSYLNTSSRNQLATKGYPNRHWPYYNKHLKTFYEINGLTVETGISDHHKMIMTIFRSTFAKGKPKTFYYRRCKKFTLEQFQIELKEKLDEISNNSFDIFLEEFKTCLDKFAPRKEKKIRFNNSIFMTKSLREAIMLRSQPKRSLIINLRKIQKNTNSKETIV